MKRLFTFGCSYTAYCWPSYSNFLQLEFDEYENWGFSGIGNRAIAERVAECHARYKFTPDDVVIVQWSSHIRNDFYSLESLPDRSPGWKTYGSIFSYLNADLYDAKWVNTFFYEPAYLMHTLNFIMLTQCLLESIGCKWYMTSIGDVRDMGHDMRDKIEYGEKTDISKYKRDLNYDKLAWNIVPDLHVYNKPIWEDNADHWLMPLELFCQTCPELTYDFITKTGEAFVDLHPSSRQHLLWLKQELGDKLNISEETLKNCESIVENVEALYKKYKTDKIVFEFTLADKNKIAPTIDKFIWPGQPRGF